MNDYSLKPEFEKLCPGKSYDQFVALFADHFKSYIDMINFYALFGLSLGIVEEEIMGQKVKFNFDNGGKIFKKKEFKKIIQMLFYLKPEYTVTFTDTLKGKHYVMVETVIRLGGVN